MRKSLKMKLGAVGTTFAMAGALAVVASGTTGAYFSQTTPGAITGTIGNVHFDTEGTTFNWDSMMPGEKSTSTVKFTNTGSGPQDFFIVFPNRPALHALNNLGSYGEVHVTGGKSGAIIPLFDSANLQDGRTKADGTNSCGSTSSPFTPAGCWPLPNKLLIAQDVARGATGSVSFSFNYPSTISNAWQGGTFNSYPSNGPGGQAFGDDLVTPGGNGLPFQIVALQVGQTP